ncbi:MAG: TraR/DksA C4-type zinc finger protein [Brachybacterium sp.]
MLVRRQGVPQGPRPLPCGRPRPIAPARLVARPEATRCIDCAP